MTLEELQQGMKVLCPRRTGMMQDSAQRKAADGEVGGRGEGGRMPPPLCLEDRRVISNNETPHWPAVVLEVQMHSARQPSISTAKCVFPVSRPQRAHENCKRHRGQAAGSPARERVGNGPPCPGWVKVTISDFVLVSRVQGFQEI